MIKRVLILIFVVIVGVTVGVTIVVKGQERSFTRQILERQNRILQLQGNIAEKLGLEEAAGSSTGGKGLEGVLREQKLLGQRLAGIESRLKDLEVSARTPVKEVKGPEQRPPAEEDTKVYDIKAGQSLVKGDKNAPVTVVEFLDFQCPFSARFHPILTEVLKAYPQEVKYIAKNFPLSFHPQARPAAKAALAAGEQGKYWEMVDALLQNGNNLSEETFKKLAGDLGLRVEKFLKDLKEKDEEWEKRIEEDLALTRQINVRGTPTFFINGRKTAARDVESFKKEIDKALEEVKNR